MTTIHKPALVVGLTGGIGAGKSTIVRTIQNMGIPVFDCDTFVHALYLIPENIETLTERYGDMKGHARLTMAELAWKDPEIRGELEGFFLPQVTLGILSFIDRNVRQERKVVVIDAPTLLEHGMQNMVDWIIVVEANLDQRCSRVMSRPGMTVEKFNAVVDAQVSDFTRRGSADSVIFNNSTIESAQNQTRNIFTKLQRIANA